MASVGSFQVVEGEVLNHYQTKKALIHSQDIANEAEAEPISLAHRPVEQALIEGESAQAQPEPIVSVGCQQQIAEICLGSTEGDVLVTGLVDCRVAEPATLVGADGDSRLAPEIDIAALNVRDGDPLRTEMVGGQAEIQIVEEASAFAFAKRVDLPSQRDATGLKIKKEKLAEDSAKLNLRELAMVEPRAEKLASKLVPTEVITIDDSEEVIVASTYGPDKVEDAPSRSDALSPMMKKLAEDPKIAKLNLGEVLSDSSFIDCLSSVALDNLVEKVEFARLSIVVLEIHEFIINKIEEEDDVDLPPCRCDICLFFIDPPEGCEDRILEEVPNLENDIPLEVPEQASSKLRDRDKEKVSNKDKQLQKLGGIQHNLGEGRNTRSKKGPLISVDLGSLPP